MELNKKLLLVGSIAIATLPILSVVSCSFSDRKPENKPEDGSGNGGTTDENPPVEIPNYSDNTIIETIPKQLLNDNTKIIPFYQLLKYTLQIPKIKVNGNLLTIEEQRARYVEVLDYITGYPSKFTSFTSYYNSSLGDTGSKKNSIADVAFRTWGREDDIFKDRIPRYSESIKRFFWNDNEQWRNEFAATMPEDDRFVASTIAIPYYIHCENMKQVFGFTFYYAWYKIQLIDAASQSGLAKEYFANGKTYNAYQAAEEALKYAQEYLNPLTGQQMMSSKPLDGLFGSFSYYGISAQGNLLTYKYMVDVINKEIAPFVYSLGGFDTTIPNIPSTYRNWEQVFANVAGQKVKYQKDWTEEELKQFWTTWYNYYSKTLNWRFDGE